MAVMAVSEALGKFSPVVDPFAVERTYFSNKMEYLLR
jgi:hypothetical protein